PGGRWFESTRPDQIFQQLTSNRRKNSPPSCPPKASCLVSRRYVYCGNGTQPSRGVRFTTAGETAGRAWRTGRFRCQRSWSPTAADRCARRLDQEDRAPTRRQSLGRVFPSLDGGREWPARATEKGKDAGTCFDAKTRGSAEAGRVHRRIHR